MRRERARPHHRPTLMTHVSLPRAHWIAVALALAALVLAVVVSLLRINSEADSPSPSAGDQGALCHP